MWYFFTDITGKIHIMYKSYNVFIGAIIVPLLAVILCDSEDLFPWTLVGGDLSSLSLSH